MTVGAVLAAKRGGRGLTIQAVIPPATPVPSPSPQPGSHVFFTGLGVKVTTGKAAATFITIDGHAIRVLGAGVATREFSSQTSPQELL